MAEGILKSRLKELGREDIVASSMGTHGMRGEEATGYAVTICAEHSIDISAHRSRPLIPEELKTADLIFTMEPVQKDYIHFFFPQVSDRTFLFGSWPDKETKKGMIKDPVGGTYDQYNKTFKIISDHVDRTLPIILLRFPPKNILN